MSAERGIDFDVERLEAHLRGLLGPSNTPVEVRRTEGGMSNPTYFTGTSTLAASGLRSRAQTSTLAGLRERMLRSSQFSVRPESMMSSTTSTCRPSISRSRSLRIRTTPLELVLLP